MHELPRTVLRESGDPEARFWIPAYAGMSGKILPSPTTSTGRSRLPINESVADRHRSVPRRHIMCWSWDCNGSRKHAAIAERAPF
jgi:hypothetical protein